jgi:hypothetical protein
MSGRGKGGRGLSVTEKEEPSSSVVQTRTRLVMSKAALVQNVLATFKES